MGGAAGGGPDRTEVGKLDLQALDFEAERRTAGEHQRHHAGRRIGLGKFHRQQIEHGGAVLRVDVAALEIEHAVEAQHRAAAAIFRAVFLRRFPIEAIDRDDEPLLARLPANVGDLEDGILEMGRDDLDVVLDRKSVV